MKWLRRLLPKNPTPQSARSTRAILQLEVLESRDTPSVAPVGMASPHTASVSYQAIDIPGQGVFLYSSATGMWQNITQSQATSLSVDANGDVVGEFPNYFGVWLYTNSATPTWTNLTQSDASDIEISQNGIVVGEFPSYFGVWRFENSVGWQNITQNDASALAVDNNGDVVGNFPGYFGVWLFTDATGWTNITQSQASVLAISSNGIITGEFPSYFGTWLFQNGTWTNITQSDASSLSVDSNGDVVGNFPNFNGVWVYNNLLPPSWINLNFASADQVAITDDGSTIYGVFESPQGVWTIQSSGGWQQINSQLPDVMATYG